jgi:hypothetical protein
MRASSTPHTFDQLLSNEKVRIEAQLKEMKPGSMQDVLRRKLAQIETAPRMEKWRTSKELQPPK